MDIKEIASWGLLVVMCSSPVILFFSAAYGDYTETGKWPWTKKKKDSTNSGAKFG